VKRHLVPAVAALGLALGAPSAAMAFPVRVLATVPDPGFVSDTALGPDGTIYGATFFSAAGNAGDGTPSRVFAWSPSGALEHTWTVRGQNLSQNHGVQTTVFDAVGRLYLLDTSPARVLVFDPRTGAQRTYATIPDVPACSSAGQNGCSQSLLDNAPEPDYAAWGPDGSLYVTDDQQAAVFRIPPGGGTARVWLTSPRFDAILFGLTGLALMPDGHTLMAATVGSNPAVDLDATAGSLVEIPIEADGSAGEPRTFWTSNPLDAPDGFAFARSGDVYVALLGPGVNQLAELSPQGELVTRFPSLADNLALTPPFDSPSSVTFDGSSLLVTNDSYFLGARADQVIFSVDVGEPGAPIFVPAPAAPPPAPAPVAAPRLHVHVTVARAGARVSLRVRVSNAAGRPLSGAKVRVAGHLALTNRHGLVCLRVRVGRRARALVVRITHVGYAPRSIRIRVVRARG
jgi:sugar lactone lactonase YvrE